MTPEKDKILCEKYPKIFKHRHASKMESAMAWGFECNDGWFDIIDVLCHEIQHYVDWKSKDSSEEEKESLQVIATQVKEKFGSLRFYYYGGDDVVEGMVSIAETMSYRTCEDCGNPGKKRNTQWIRVLCDNCSKEMK